VLDLARVQLPLVPEVAHPSLLVVFGMMPAGAKPARNVSHGRGSRPAACARSIRTSALRTAWAPVYRTGSGGNRPARSPTNGEVDHASRSASASDARIRPPSRDGPTPFPL